MGSRTYFLGLDEVSGELNPNNDLSLKNEYIAHFAGAIKAKTIRVWVKLDLLFKVGENDELEFNPKGFIDLHRYLEALKKQGVERFLFLDWGFVYPFGYDFGGDTWVVPSPKDEKDYYYRFLRLQEKTRFELARNFVEFEYFEPTNEPESDGMFLHKRGYNKANDKTNYIYSREEVASICLDLCFFNNRGVKRANKNAKVFYPSFCNFDYAPSYLSNVFEQILSGNLPSFGPKSKNIGDYFELISLHPYNLKDAEINDYWLDTQYKIYDVVKKYAPNMKAWVTEAGWSDFKRQSEKEKIGDRFIKLFDAINEKLPWIETVFPFRVFTLSNVLVNEGEDNFGLVYNQYDWNYSLMPKPAMIDIFKYANGKDADTEVLYKYANTRDTELFPNKLIGDDNPIYKVLFFGNYITYQKEAPWNNWNMNCGLGASKENFDYAHQVLDGLRKQYKKVQGLVVDAKYYETDFHYNFFDSLKKFKEYDADLVIFRLGENFYWCELNDNPVENDLIKLVNFFKTDKNKVLFTNAFHGFERVNDSIKNVAVETNSLFVDINDIEDELINLSKTKYPSKEYKAIPSDVGHRAIADRILKELN